MSPSVAEHSNDIVAEFTRYRTDGSVIGRFPSMWIVTLRKGRWGVEARSSFAP